MKWCLHKVASLLPFGYINCPRKLIPTNTELSKCNLITPIVVVAELSEDAPDILDVFSPEV